MNKIELKFFEVLNMHTFKVLGLVFVCGFILGAYLL